MSHPLLEGLNPEQRYAVETIHGPVLIIAGAGSGKTRVITHRIAYMLDHGIDPRSILALTFTNKAADEMAERVKHLLHAGASGGRERAAASQTAKELTISTFHAFGLAVMRRYGRVLGYRDNFSVYDTGDQVAALKESAREAALNPDDLEIFNLLQVFSALKVGRIDWNDEKVYELADGRGVSRLQALYESYHAHLLVYNAVDFDDLIVRPLELFREHPKVRDHYTERFKYVMVDEFQDTSTIQYKMMYHLSRESENICVVGDDDQSIYSWRGADYRNLQAFEADFPRRVEIKLERNYRSTGQILAAANSVIANNTNRKEKALWTQQEGGAPIELLFPDDEEAEAAFIAAKIKLLAFESGISYDDFGILIRTNGQARAIEEALLEANLPYRMSGGQSFFQRKEIKDIAAYLRVILNPDDNVNLLRIINVPRRGIGRKTLEQLTTFAESRRISLFSAIAVVAHEGPPEAGTYSRNAIESFHDFLALIERYQNRFEEGGRGIAATVDKLAHEVNYWGYLATEFQKNERAAKAKWRNIQLFVKSIGNYERNPDVVAPSLAGYLTRISLQVRDELQDVEGGGKVNLMTIHAAKGLEHEIVFLAGVEEGLIPHERSAEEAGTVEEERRLFYVAITRARRKLYMTSCRRRQVMRDTVDCAPSPFIQEIPAELLEHGSMDPAAGLELPQDPFAALRAKMGA